jgi:ubiquinone/menaquinone biosynthesis C-methylase UbiE
MADHAYPWWFSYAFDNPLRKLLHRPQRMLAAYVNPGQTCLDLGCGRGYFSLGLAQLVGESGKVYAVDRKKKMLDLLQKRAAKAGLAERILPRLSGAGGLGLAFLEGLVDFALCFWMLHEVKGQPAFLAEVALLLKPGGLFLLAEPKGHVALLDFEQFLATASRTGLEVVKRPKVALSRAALLKKPELASVSEMAA